MKGRKNLIVSVPVNGYPSVVQLDQVMILKEKDYIPIPAYTDRTVILTMPQTGGLVPNRAIYEEDMMHIRTIICGDFLVCGMMDGQICGMTQTDIEMYMEKFHQRQQFITAGSIVFAVPLHRIYDF